MISTLPGTQQIAKQAITEWIDRKSSPVICDLAYGGLERQSPLVEGAKRCGWRAFDGRDMLVEQAALSLVRWTGGEVSAIRRAMRAALKAATRL